MNVIEKQATLLRISDVDGLDPIDVVLQDYGPGKGEISIACYGKAWTAYWGGMGGRTIAEFLCSCDEHYIAGKLDGQMPDKVYDIDAIQKAADKKGIEVFRDDPWNDYEFMRKMYGDEMYEWHSSLPTKTNPDYQYLCRIINAVKTALKNRIKAS